MRKRTRTRRNLSPLHHDSPHPADIIYARSALTIIANICLVLAESHRDTADSEDQHGCFSITNISRAAFALQILPMDRDAGQKTAKLGVLTVLRLYGTTWYQPGLSPPWPVQNHERRPRSQDRPSRFTLSIQWEGRPICAGQLPVERNALPWSRHTAPAPLPASSQGIRPHRALRLSCRTITPLRRNLEAPKRLTCSPSTF